MHTTHIADLERIEEALQASNKQVDILIGVLDKDEKTATTQWLWNISDELRSAILSEIDEKKFSIRNNIEGEDSE